MNIFTSKKEEKQNEENINIDEDKSLDLLMTDTEKKESSKINLADIHFGEAYEPSQSPNTDEKQPDNFFFEMGNVTLLNNTTIYFNCYVEKYTVDEAIRLLKRVNQNLASIEIEYPEIKGTIPIKFVINSGGGNVIQGLRLFDAIKNNIYPVTTIANGMAASMGIIILVAGKKVQSTENSTLMIHQLSAGAQGKYSELRDHMKFQTDLQEKLKDILVQNTSAKKEDIEKFMQGETYLMATDALKLGIIQTIVNI